MAKPARGLPADFALDLPEESPVMIGDFLDEPPPAPMPARRPEPTAEKVFRPEIVPDRVPEPRYQPAEQTTPARLPKRAQPNVIRYQLNLTPKAKRMLEEVVEHVRTYSPENDARVSEVFQGIIGLLHGAMEELELSELPRRGAWGSVTAKNFPGALSEAFEAAILRAAEKRRR
jgi:hypothetical protein